MVSEGAHARYPELHVSVRSPRPIAVVAAVRDELRRAGVRHADVARFTQQALTHPENIRHVLAVAGDWVGAVDAPVAGRVRERQVPRASDRA